MGMIEEIDALRKKAAAERRRKEAQELQQRLLDEQIIEEENETAAKKDIGRKTEKQVETETCLGHEQAPEVLEKPDIVQQAGNTKVASLQVHNEPDLLNTASQEQIQSSDQKPLPISFSGLKAKKRKRTVASDIAARSTEQIPEAQELPPSLKKVKPSTASQSAVSTSTSETATKSEANGVFGPQRKPPRSKKETVYKSVEIVDTQYKPSEWYLCTDTNQKFSRGDLQTVAHVKTIIKICIERTNTTGGPEKYFSELRTRIHEMEFYEFLNAIIVKKSKVLEEEGLLQIFDGQHKSLFPWDIVADSEALWHRWMGGELNPSLLRGITTTKGTLDNDKKRISHKLDKEYTKRKSANVVGANGLINGQWWPSRICCLRDGAHGEQEAGIHGQIGKGAFSVVIAAGGYDDKDNGKTRTKKKQPVRVLRAVNKKSIYAPKEGIRYDGLYEIVSKEILNPKTAMFRFSFQRLSNQDPIRYKGEERRPTNQELKERMKIRELLA
ncbi:hypothetical protein B7494_g5292 [Chlorociboria aeruginascens]|nr:hypothetical protein B7494_g5292 [Chlorociboria aeruginascens]